MKKNIFLLTVVLISFTTSAQDYYTFTKSSRVYEDLVNPITMTRGLVWSFQDLEPAGTGFTIKIFGHEHYQFNYNGSFNFADYNGRFFSSFRPVTTIFLDRNFTFVGPGESDISYKVEGVEGEKIFKIQMKNVGFYSDYNFTDPQNAVSTHFMNYQIWFFENNDVIEFHYGPHNVTDLATLNVDESLFPYFSTKASDVVPTLTSSSVVVGPISEPVYVESVSTSPSEPLEYTSLDAMIEPNTVYRFEVTSLLSTQDSKKVGFLLYPNPTSDVLNLSFDEINNSNYSVFDLLGREVLFGKIDNKMNEIISVENLQKGTYILRLDKDSKIFIKK